MLTERQIEPCYVAFYNIWPRNGLGLVLQPRSQHGVNIYMYTYKDVGTQTVQQAFGILLFVCLVFNGTFSTYRLYRTIEVRSIM